MDIIVCVKRVPEVAEAEVKIDPSGKKIDERDLVFDINEWDDYALEEALLLKEKYGGRVTAITVGGEEAEDVLRKCLAKGADEAIRIDGAAVKDSDAFAIAKTLWAAIKSMKFDLVLTGAQAADDGCGIVGPVLAYFLGVPHATLVKKVEVLNGKLRVHRELEGGLEEVLELEMPALLTIQTGINQPRYVSVLGIRRAARKEIKVLSPSDLGLGASDVGEAGSWTKLIELTLPKVEIKTEFISGSADEVATKLLSILRSRGLV